MISDFFDSPELLDIQRTDFYHFLNEGIPQLLAKQFPIKIKNGSYSLELCLNEKNVKLLAPEDEPRDCILKMKTYNCKLYAQVKIVCKRSSSFGPKEKIVYQGLPEWVLLGQLPIMTKRGHFIINGSPRVIVHQVVRSPGIYFQKLLKKDDQNKDRFYGDIIPLKGVWVRLQMTKKGRVEAKFKKGKKVEVELLQKCLQVVENQTFSSYKSSLLFTGGEESNSNKSKIGNPYGALLPKVMEEKPVVSLSYKSKPLQIGDLYGAGSFAPKALPPTLCHQRSAIKAKPLQSGALYAPYKSSICKGNKNSIAKEEDPRFLLYDDYSKLLSKKKSRAESKAEHDAFVHTYDKLYRTTQDKELEEWQKKKKNQKFFKGSCIAHFKEQIAPNGIACKASNYFNGAQDGLSLGAKKEKADLYSCKPDRQRLQLCKPNGKKDWVLPSVQTKGKTVDLNEQDLQSEALYASGFPLAPESTFKQKRCSENLFATFKIQSRYDLGLLGREKIDTKLGLHGKKGKGVLIANTQLTALDLCSATLWLYRLRRGEQSTDDIDHSQNRRVRTSGELFQAQFENGVYRLRNLLSTKLQEWRGDRSSSIFSSIFKASFKTRYSSKVPYFKRWSKAELSYTEKKDLATILSSHRSYSTVLESTDTKLLTYKALRNKSSVTKQSFVKQVQSSAYKATATKKAMQELKKKWSSEASLWKETSKTLTNLVAQRGSCQKGQLPLQVGDLYGAYKAPLCKGFARESLPWRQSLYKAELCTPLRATRLSHQELSYKLSAKELFSTKPITGALREFFGSNPLSQYMDQTNPLAEITHKRRISSLGVGGVSRESAGMAIRGIHPTHYGRICPIETPEGKNAGLVNSLAFCSKVDKNGSVKTPYYRVFKGQVQSSLGFSFCSARDELLTGLLIAPSDLQRSRNNILRTKSSTLESVPVRVADNFLDIFKKENPYKVELIATSPVQMISVATSLIPFLEHNDANRALMGSNMQRQAVPLMISERPIVGTGLESIVVIESGHITESQRSGFASHVADNRVVVDTLSYRKKEGFLSLRAVPCSAHALLPKGAYKAPLCKGFALLPEGESKPFGNCPFGQQGKAFTKRSFVRPITFGEGRRFVRAGWKQDRSRTRLSFRKVCERWKPCPRRQLPLQIGDLYGARGVAPKALSWRQSLYKAELCTPLRGTSLCQKVFARESLPPRIEQKESFLTSTVSTLTTFFRSNQNTCITERPLIRERDWIQKGDVLSDCSASNNGELAVGKNVLIAYIPWEGYNFEDAIVISDRLVREHVYTSLHIERYVFQAQDLKDGNEWFTKHLPGVEPRAVEHLEESGLPKIGSFLKEGNIIVGKIRYLNKKPSSPYERLLCDILGEKNFAARNKSLYVPKGVEGRVVYHKIISFFDNDPTNKLRPADAAKTVHLFLGEKRVIQVGDKISGRHGNKGVISTILPREDMPYLPDGTPIDIVLNPLGVPSRMNVGQVLECLLGLAATYLGQHFKIAAFDERYGVEASKSIVFLKLYQARLLSGQSWLFQVAFPGKTRLVDGRSGECFDQWITVGRAYILKLIHMVSEKIHARSTGPYALITQQPLRGRSNKGGQRLGEMEVWALEGFGAAYTLQELLTKKSDDSFGRKQIVDSILPSPVSVVDTLKPSTRIDRNKNVLGHPEIFKVLLCELQALCLDLGVYAVTPDSFQRSFLGRVH